MQKGLDLLLEKYSVASAAELTSYGTVKVNGTSVPLLPWESERRFMELRNLVVQKRVGNMCTYRIGHTTHKGADLFEVLRREAGIIEFTVDSKITEIFAIAGKNTMNAIAETANGCVCTLELAAILPEGEAAVDKHEIITDNGIACDRVVDTQVPQNSIYLFGENKAAFTDVDAELYGYSVDEIAVIRNAFAVCKSEAQFVHNAEAAAGLDKVVAAAKESLETLENVKVAVDEKYPEALENVKVGD